MLGDEVLRFLLKREQAVLVEDHLHAILPEPPGLCGHVVVNPLAELAGPRHLVEPGEVLLELHAEDGSTGGVAGRLWRYGGRTGIHTRILRDARLYLRSCGPYTHNP